MHLLLESYDGAGFLSAVPGRRRLQLESWDQSSSCTCLIHSRYLLSWPIGDLCLSVILVGSVVYAVFGCLGASLSAQCFELYGLDYLEAGLIYLPSGLGGIIAAYTIGDD